MILESMIIKGLNNGIVKLIPCPHAQDEIVCKIGEYWFYFDDRSEKSILEKIMSTLYYFATDNTFIDEYDYYYAILANMKE